MDKSKMLENMLEVLRKSDPERLARLEEMGYDTSKAYFHGTDAPFDEFDPNKSMGSYGPGIYFTDNPLTAEHYARAYQYQNKHGRIIPVFLKKGEYLNTRNVDTPLADKKRFAEIMVKILDSAPEKNRFISDITDDNTFEGGERVFRNMAENTSPFNSLSELWDQAYNKNTSQLGKEMSKHNVEGFQADFSNGTAFTGERTPETYKIVPNPDNIKSIWAKGKGPGLLGGFAAMPNMNPLEDLRKFVNKYREVQGPLADRITEEVSKPFGGADEGLKTLGRIGFDPLNIGAAGEVMGAIELLTPEQKKEKLMKSMEKK